MTIRKDVVQINPNLVVDDYYVYEQGNVALIVPMLKSGKLCMVRQYKHASKDIVIEFPAGFIDTGETSLSAGIRELHEETGLKSSRIEPLQDIIDSPSKIQGKISAFIAYECEHAPDQENHQDLNENIETLELTVNEIVDMIKTGTINTASTITAFYAALQVLNQIEIKPLPSSQ